MASIDRSTFIISSLAILAAASLPGVEAGAQSSKKYLTLVAGRAFWSAASPACAPYADAVTVDLLEVAQRLKDRAVPLKAFATIVGSWTRSDTRYCPGLRGAHDIYPTWSDLRTLRESYGWTVGSNGKTRNPLVNAGSTLEEQWDTSCGALIELRKKGHYRGSGMFAYPGGGNQDDVTDEVQSDVVSKCYAFGRKYTDLPPFELNQRSDEGSPSANPFGWQWTHNIYGGQCNISTLPCYNRPVQIRKRYESPSTLAQVVRPASGEWGALQFHAFVTGSRLTGSGDTWDCTAADWRYHWTSRSELYCWEDFEQVLNQIPTDVTVTDPETVARAWGRAIPPPVISALSPISGSTGGGEKITISGQRFRSVGSPENGFLNGKGFNVKIGGISARVIAVGTTWISVITPSHTLGTVDMRVANADGRAVVKPAAFTYR
ncbi:MAG: IPT/TIG domain-containing protein [bacterium]